MKYHAKKLETIETKPGCWKYSRIGVFENEKQIGEYQRNYSSFGESTFCPFIGADGKWYAVYSENYTATNIMSLPDCKKIGGEEPNSYGFCPTELYVARYTECIFKAMPESELQKYPEASRKILKVDRIEREYEDSKEWESELEASETDNIKFLGNIKYDLRLGFVAGCVWGDDSSWKIERLDLTEAHNGILKREQTFGYLQLPDFPLRDCIKIFGCDNTYNVGIACVKWFYMKNGIVKHEAD